MQERPAQTSLAGSSDLSLPVPFPCKAVCPLNFASRSLSQLNPDTIPSNTTFGCLGSPKISGGMQAAFLCFSGSFTTKKEGVTELIPAEQVPPQDDSLNLNHSCPAELRVGPAPLIHPLTAQGAVKEGGYVGTHLLSYSQTLHLLLLPWLKRNLPGHTAILSGGVEGAVTKTVLCQPATQKVAPTAAGAHSPAPTSNPLLHNLISFTVVRFALPHHTIPFPVPQTSYDSHKEEIFPGALLKAQLPKPKTGSVNIKAFPLMSNLS